MRNKSWNKTHFKNMTDSYGWVNVDWLCNSCYSYMFLNVLNIAVQKKAIFIFEHNAILNF